MSKLLLFPVALLVIIPVFLFKLARLIIRFARHPVLEYRAMGHYFLVCKQLRKAELRWHVKAKRDARHISVMFYERSTTGNRFVYMFALDETSLVVSKYVWEGGLSGEDRSKLVRFEAGLLQELKALFQMRGDELPEGENRYYRIAK